MSETGTPFHYGGPLGLGALVAIAGAAGLYLITKNGPNIAVQTGQHVPPTAEPVTQDNIPPAPKMATKADPVIEGETVDVGAEEKRQALKAIKTPPPLKPIARPMQPRKIQALPAQAKGAEVTFIVRIKGSDDVDRAARLFKKDRANALRAFATYVEGAPDLRDFKLVGGSYSGEVKLAYTLPPGKTPDRATITKLKQIIMSVEGVSYADPDFVAHPGKE